jgi:hypothetical protein
MHKIFKWCKFEVFVPTHHIRVFPNNLDLGQSLQVAPKTFFLSPHEPLGHTTNNSLFMGNFTGSPYFLIFVTITIALGGNRRW